MQSYLKKNAKFVDKQVTKWSDIVLDWDGKHRIKGPALIGVPLSKASISHSGAHLAPERIRSMLDFYSTYAIEDERDVSSHTLYDCGDILMHVTDIQESHRRIEQTVAHLAADHPKMLPIILGGDHSISFPCIGGFTASRGKVGVIQFDAHHDVRNLIDGGASNGTPFRSLLDTNVIQGDHLIQIGIRDYANAKIYHDYVKQRGVRVYTMKQVRERPIQDVIRECINKLCQQVDVIYVSVDMDVLDQAFAPGCPAIGPGGMDSETLLQAIRQLAREPIVGALDIVEIDPTLDIRNMTSRVAAHVIMNFVGEQL